MGVDTMPRQRRGHHEPFEIPNGENAVVTRL